MSDLISRKAVYDMLHGLGGCDASDEWSNGWDKAIDSAIKELDKIPTAYDVDKVVEWLEDDRQQALSMADKSEYFLGQATLLSRVIPLVKGAVKDE